MKKIKLLNLILLTVFSLSSIANTVIINAGNYYYTDNNSGTSSSNISVGDTVIWINDGGYHNVNFDNNSITGNSFNNPISFISSPTNNDTLYSYIFNTPGYYQYDCSVGNHASNGMIGDINVASTSNNSVYDIVSNSSSHTTLKTAIDACSLDGVLAGPGPFTLFAPTDAAFNNLPAGTVTALLNDIPALTQILQHHVVGDSVMSTMLSNNQIVNTLLGTNITVTINANGVYIDNAMVIMADLVADNGVVHVIDAVLSPPLSSSNNIINQENYIYLYTIDVLGKKVDRKIKKQIVFDIYSNGKTIRRYNQ